MCLDTAVRGQTVELNHDTTYFDRSYVEDNRNLEWCPAPDCEHAAESHMDLAGEPLDVMCSCGNAFCFTCKDEAHRPASISHLWYLLLFSSGHRRRGGGGKQAAAIGARIYQTAGLEHHLIHKVPGSRSWRTVQDLGSADILASRVYAGRRAVSNDKAFPPTEWPPGHAGGLCDGEEVDDKEQRRVREPELDPGQHQRLPQVQAPHREEPGLHAHDVLPVPL